MSEETGSDTEVVYVRLLEEGTVVYRPAKAVVQRSGVALLVAPEGYDPNDEEWEFKPGTSVRIDRRVIEGRQVLVAIAAE